MFKVGPLFWQYALVIIVNLNLLSTGLGIAWPSPVLVKLRNANDTPLWEPITEDQGSWVVSIGSIIGLIGNLVTGYILNRFGRKFTLILASLPKIFAFLLMSFANSVWMLYVGRAALGISDAMTFTVVPMYASEIASKEVRGALGTIVQICCSLGIVTMLCMGPFIQYFTLNLICAAFSIATTLPAFFVPDSPYYLHTKGKKDEATRVLTFLRGSKATAMEELQEYELSYSEEKATVSQLLQSTPVRRGLVLVIIIGIGTQATGFNAVTFYLQTVLDSTKTSVSSEIASVIIGCIQLVASICVVFITDRFGRKPILCSSLVGTSVGLLGLGTFFKLSENGHSTAGAMQYLPLVSLVLVVYCYSAGVGSLLWPLLSELFDGQARAFGMSVGLFSTIFSLFISTRFFAPLTTAIGPAATYWMFSVNCLVFFVFILFCVPETKGRSFAEIQEALGEKTKEERREQKIQYS